MVKDKVKMLLILAIVFSLWGVYKSGKAVYTSLAWEKTDGYVSDFTRHTFSCGKHRSECYSLLVGFHVGEEFYTVGGDKKYNDPPKRLSGKKVPVYYSMSKPYEAVLGGEYGPMNTGLIALLVGGIMFVIYWFSKKGY